MEWPGFGGTRRERAATVAALEAVSEVLERSVSAASSRSSTERSQEDIESLRALLVLESAEIALRLQKIERRAEELATALAHGIEHEERRERRIQATVKRARRQLAELGVEDPGLEAEFDGLSVSDGGASEEGEVLLLPGEVEESPGVQESSIPGVTREQLQRARFGA